MCLAKAAVVLPVPVEVRCQAREGKYSGFCWGSQAPPALPQLCGVGTGDAPPWIPCSGKQGHQPDDLGSPPLASPLLPRSLEYFSFRERKDLAFYSSGNQVLQQGSPCKCIPTAFSPLLQPPQVRDHLPWAHAAPKG